MATAIVSPDLNVTALIGVLECPTPKRNLEWTIEVRIGFPTVFKSSQMNLVMLVPSVQRTVPIVYC